MGLSTALPVLSGLTVFGALIRVRDYCFYVTPKGAWFYDWKTRFKSLKVVQTR